MNQSHQLSDEGRAACMAIICDPREVLQRVAARCECPEPRRTRWVRDQTRKGIWYNVECKECGKHLGRE